ncbi:hypothetical protein J6590_078329 [Homalodisca vitripennis]|nr:hypothetical protein J6590_078329 [Homalodisca vitripennis]
MLAAMKKMDLDRLRKAEKAMTDLEKNPTKQDIRQKKTGRHLPGVRRPREPILWCRITLKRGVVIPKPERDYIVPKRTLD